MRDLRNKNSPMVGCTILFSGDFRQILPVVTRGTRADEINASLKRSNLWQQVNKLELKTNMRVSSSSRENRLFPEMLLKVGNGELAQSEERINLENLCVLIDNIQELVNNVYPDIDNISYKTISWFKERAILSPTNEQVDKVNNLILSKIDAPTKIYYSVDTVLDLEEAVHFPTEFLNSLNPSGLPPHKMVLKVGCPVILLRNLKPPKLCNGTRLLVKSLKTFIIECTILTGCGTGEDNLNQNEQNGTITQLIMCRNTKNLISHLLDFRRLYFAYCTLTVSCIFYFDPWITYGYSLRLMSGSEILV
ncbi:hypothetical protein X975_02263, partial [Stegodyphus mimosarum]